MLLHEEISEQPDVLARVLERNRDVTTEARGIIADAAHVVIAARGTSDNAARYAKYAWGTHLRAPVTLAAPSLYTRYGNPPDLSHAAVVAISQSGQSPDLLAVVEEGRQQSRPTIAIVNDPESPLADLADVVVPLHAGTEHSIAATKSYTASLASVAMVADTPGLADIPAAVAETLGCEQEIAGRVEDIGPIARAIVLGRGYNHSTAFEWALKLQEMAYVFAHGFSTADFSHGPFAMLDPGEQVLALAPAGAITADSRSILRRAAEEGGAEVTAITDVTDLGLPAIETPTVPEALTPITFIVAAQLFTLHAARVRGVDPESPRGLNKVTKTA